MVKVECHGCSAPYQIDERRIPPSGLKMRCPKCGTSLLVARPGQEAAAAAAQAAAAAPPRPAPPAAAAAPAPPAAPAWSGADLPAPAAPKGVAPGAGAGFGELDFNVELPNPGDAHTAGGEVDLPVLPNRGGGFGALDFGAPESGGVDLPAVPARAAAPAPLGGGGGGFGSLDFGDEGGAVDLPAARAPAPGGFGAAPQPFGEVDLPAPRAAQPAHGYGSAAGLPAVFGGPAMAPPASAPGPGGFGGGAGLPAAARGAAGLPMPASGGTGLPMPHAGGAGLPMPATGSAGLPMPGGGGAGLPMPGGGGVGLPMPGGGAGLPMPGGSLPAVSSGGLPMTSSGGLPMTSSGGLPMTSSGGLPMTSSGGLPAIGGPGLPGVGGPGLPSASSGGLPSAAGPGLPSNMSHAGLPVVGGAGLPVTGGASLPSPVAGVGGGPADLFPSPSGLGMQSGGVGSEVSFGDDAGGVNVGAVNLGPLGSSSGIGAEVDLDASAGASAPKGKPAREKRSVDFDDDAPQRRSRGVKIVGGAILLLGVGGGSLALVDSIGPFGAHFIGDRINAEKYDASLLDLRTSAQGSMDADTLAAMTAAGDQVKAAHADRERHQDTRAYGAFVLYMRIVRFGPDAGTQTTAKTLLDGTDRNVQTVPMLLAVAAEDTVGNQLAKAKQSLEQVLAKSPGDVDALVLLGEIELRSKDPAAATKVFSEAVTSHKSARTLFGLARAQIDGGKTAEAEATARSVLEVSKNHVAARTLIARVASATPTREPEALKLLLEITKEPEVRAAASQTELVEAYTQLGNVHLLGSRVTQAQEAFSEALKIEPLAVEALVGSGDIFYRGGRYSEAEARFESALRKDADNLDAKIGTAKTWIALERIKEAKDFLAKLQSAYPEDSRVFYWIARVSEALGNRKDAEGYYGQAIEKAKNAEQGVAAYVSLAALLTANNKGDQANKKLAEAAEKYPDSAELARARGNVALQSGRYEEALNQFEQALKKSDDLQTRFQVGVTLRKMRKFDEAIAVFDKVSKIDPDYPNLALERGLYFEETGQGEEAVKMYNEALKRAPNDVDLKLRIGSTQVAAGAGKQAEPILKEVIRERSNSAEANHFLGRAMLISGSNLNESMRYLKRAVELDPNRAEYHFYVGWAANDAGQPDLAASSLAKALELDSSMGDAYWQRGVLLANRGQVADAITDLMTALEKRPSRYEAHAALAGCYENQKNLTKAEASYREAIKGNDKIPEWHWKLGRLLDDRGDKKAALLELEKAVELAATKEPRPGWLGPANLRLAELKEAAEPDKALAHYKEYLRLSPQDDAYRPDAEKAIARLEARLKK